MTDKMIYEFGNKTDGDVTMRALLGGKGANLAEMSRIGLPVPPGFTITTAMCIDYYKTNRQLMPELKVAIKQAIGSVESQLNKKFGDTHNPLLFSVRSGARESMPGMMDTILNLGLNDATVEGFASITHNPRFAYDCYRRFIQMYGDVVMGIGPKSEDEHDPFDSLIAETKEIKGVKYDTDLEAEDLKQLVNRFKALVRERAGKDFPQDVFEQLEGAIGAVFGSWHNERASIYRRKYNIPSDWGTAVNVQAMVFGNAGNTSATGVAFTRNPANGENTFYGEYLINAQGEDVVAGIRTPNPIAQLSQEMPKAYEELLKIRARLEEHFKDMQDFEFTVENQRLFMLQTRNGKRTGLSAIKIAIDMVNEGLIDKETAIKRIPAESIATLLVPIFDNRAKKQSQCIATGLPAGPGAASGKVVFSAVKAEEWSARGDKVVLCRAETSPEDLRGMLVSEGILTSRGGVSSHAALVARQMGKVCVCGAGDLIIDYRKRCMTAGNVCINEGDSISIDGTTGEVFQGGIPTMPSEVMQVLNGHLKADESETYRMFHTIMSWSDTFRQLGIRTNADTPQQAALALSFGAEGIGLCRTEHMFFEGHRIDSMREMILANSEESRRKALAKLLPLQKNDFKGIFKAMKGYPVTIRLLDPPLHEFLPHEDDAIEALSKVIGLSVDQIKVRSNALAEQNPMLGHRGCRLGITYPEITEMQATAIFEAAAEIIKEGLAVKIEVMVPLVGFVKELEHQIHCIHATAQKVFERYQVEIPYHVGTMIENPRAAVRSDEIAKVADFFSFGTNDLTQLTLGISRDDMGKFFKAYTDLEIFTQNPFASIDVEGVGELVKISVAKAKSAKSSIKLGVCGEHGGDPHSVQFFQAVGLNYVSCSPNRIPIVRLACAQAALKNPRQ
ncbi:MAG: pyruvate, phosphate dikinase [Puniceicoccales bacterium]|jgi:pyruvate,orthophosphate dikinase|nr:pyruvate, phosphate dikinase [Puniceicoccales bacterium]